MTQKEKFAVLRNDEAVRHPAGPLPLAIHPNIPIPQVAPNWADQNELIGKEPALGWSVDALDFEVPILERMRRRRP